jgi:Flp pilus assembly protein CpaB
MTAPRPPARDVLAGPLRRVARRTRRAVLRRRRPLAGVLAAVAVASGLHATVGPPPARVSVLVAARDLPSGTVLSDGDLTRAAFAPGTAPDGLAAPVVGRTLAAPLRRGEPVTDVRVVGPGLTRTHPGLVALPVRLPDAAMVALLAVGDRIDLVAADPRGAPARVVARGVPVLALPRDVGDDPSGGGTAMLPGRLVVVGVPDAEVPQVADAAARRLVTLTLDR